MTDTKPENPMDRLPDFHLKTLERNLCVCNEVPKITVVNAIIEGATSVAEVREKTYATDGNGCCRVQVEFLLGYLLPTED